MFLVGLTGGIASGKSSVATMLKNMGIRIIDADQIAREVVEPNKKAWKAIRKEFGESVFNNDGTLDRQALGLIVFSDTDKRKLLNSIVHPEVYNSIFRKCLRLFFSGHQFAVIDVPLLFESGKMIQFVHKTIVVSCDPSLQLERLMKRDKLTEPDAMARINAQMPLSEKVKFADFVINNNGSIESTQQQVEKMVLELRRSKAHWKYRLVLVTCSVLPLSLLGYGIYRLYVYYR